jgi:hypothetical protein
VDFLKANLNVFAWKPSDMKGIPIEVAKHKLNIKLGSKPVKQPSSLQQREVQGD